MCHYSNHTLGVYLSLVLNYLENDIIFYGTENLFRTHDKSVWHIKKHLQELVLHTKN